MDDESKQILAISKEGYFDINASQIEQQDEGIQRSLIQTADALQTKNIVQSTPYWKVPLTQFNSSFTMQQPDLPRFTMNTKTNRFQRNPKGGATAETYYVNTSFKPTNEFFKPILKAPEEIPSGRPLWLSEINK
jgi:hypothetical protein